MQALIITAYKNYDQLVKNLKIYSEVFQCFVHIDAKSPISTKENLEELNRIPHVTALSTYKINWGSYYHMMAILDLLKLARSNPTIQRFHIISGEDFPIKAYGKFEEFFHENSNNYLEVTDISEMPVMRLRYEKFHFMHIFNRQSPYGWVIFLDKVIRQVQYRIPFTRKTKYRYKGLVWSSITDEAIDLVLDNMDNKRIRNLKYCETAEEFFLQNILMTKVPEKVVMDHLRFASWQKGSKFSPGYLDESDYPQIQQSSCFFARKIAGSGTDSQQSLYRHLMEDFLE